MILHERLTIPEVRGAARNIGRHYAIQGASWVWHPDHLHAAPIFLRFHLAFDLKAARETVIHVSADERYELFIDGTMVSMGPDRGDVEHWRFASLRVELEAGRHEIEALAWYLGPGLRPQAQTSLRGGFILAAEGLAHLATGAGNWSVEKIDGITCARARQHALPGYLDVGPAFELAAGTRLPGCAGDDRRAERDASACGNTGPGGGTPPGGRAPARPALPARVRPVVVAPPLPEVEQHGIAQPGWALVPSQLPGQLRRRLTVGTVRAIRYGEAFDSLAPWAPADLHDTGTGRWQAMLNGEALRIAPGVTVEAIVDLCDYYCGFATPVAEATGAAGTGGDAGDAGAARNSHAPGAEIVVEWAETLYESLGPLPRKGNRDAIAGKIFVGFHDRYGISEERREHRALWWRAGRYLRVWVHAGQGVTLHGIPVVECRYPLALAGSFRSSDPTHEPIRRIAVRGIESSLHETWTDTPFYEQMMYVGDTRLELLVAAVTSPDARPARLAIDLLECSRWKSGFVAERYPSDHFQLALTFSMIWILIVRDFALYYDEPDYAADRLHSVRQMLEEFRRLLRPAVASGDLPLLPALPGWSFTDWVAAWSGGIAPAGDAPSSAPVNLLFALSLIAAAELEEWHGEAAMAVRDRALAEAVVSAVLHRFWVDEPGLLADDGSHTAFSEHAQALGVVTGLLGKERERSVLAHLEQSVRAAASNGAAAASAVAAGAPTAGPAPRLERTTVYFSYYLHEAFFRLGRADLFDLDLYRWRRMAELGLRTPIEDDSRPVCRSDCHAWGAHPLYHFHAGLAGVRPAAPGYREVMVAPQPGGLAHIESVTPHPRGEVGVVLEFDEGACRATVTLPPGTPGELRWKGQTRMLSPGARSEVAIEPRAARGAERRRRGRGLSSRS